MGGGGVTETVPFNGYEYVDMGEAGIWAKYPIGITEWNNTWKDDVLYFQWGDIEGYTVQQVKDGEKNFDWPTYKFGGNSSGGQTKYNSSDNLTILEPEDDAAHINMGGLWRMPMKEEFQNLYDLCDSEWVTDYNGISGLNGRLFTLKSDNTKQLFVSTPGICVSSFVSGVGSYGNFWSSSVYESNPNSGFYLLFSSTSVSLQNNGFRCFGQCVVGFLDSTH